MAKEKIQSAGGVGESKIFCAPAEERVPSHEDQIMGCHINGVAIRDLKLDPQVIAALDYYATDEGAAEKAANPQLREPSGVTLGADPFDKSLLEKRDDVKQRGMDLGQARDPLREVADRYARPGMNSRFLSKQRIKDNGGTGDFVVVKTPEGDPVTVHGMILSHIPAEVAQQRREYYHRRGAEMLKQIGEQYKKEGGPTAVADQ